MPRLELVRHAMTKGNLERRWTGTTDESLCPEGTALARRCVRPKEDIPRRVWTSPLRRCMETAALLYPGAELVPVPALRETGFGSFENKNHEELEGDPLYERWTRSGGEASVPGLESREEVKARVLPAFRAIAEELLSNGEDAAVVTHGGVVMALCEAFGEPKREYSLWWTPCCGGWRMELERGPRLVVEREIMPPREDIK